MKIFDWVHRKKHTNMEYRRVPHDRKGDPYVGDGGSEGHGEKKAEPEKEALLLDLHHVTSIQHVLDGILTIGTLGHLDYQCQQEFFEVDSNAYKIEAVEAEEEKEEEEQVVAELTAASAHPNPNLATESFKKEMLEKVDINNGNMENIADEEGSLLEPLLKEIKANRRERITLADLFLASDDQPAVEAEPTSQVASAPGVAPEKKANGAVDGAARGESPSCRAKHGRSLTKKLAPWKKRGEDSPPATKKIHRMIRRMLKKKVHPEMARDMHASVPGAQACRGDDSSDESASLL